MTVDENLGGGALAAALCGVLATAALPQDACAQDVRLRLDSAAMLIGSPNRLLVFGAPADAVVDFTPLDTVAAFEPLGEVARVDVDGEAAVALPFSVYDSVGLTLPGLAVISRGETLRTNPVALLVDFPPSDSTVYSYRGIRREAANLSDYAPWIAAAVTVLLLLGGLWAYWRFRKTRNAVIVPQRVVPPHERALAQLDALARADAPDDKAYYSALDRILRTYLEGRYELPALERTTAEVTRLMRARGLPVEGLPALLDEVDLVKFARAELPAARRSESLARVRAFVEATRPAPEPALTESAVTESTARE